MSSPDGRRTHLLVPLFEGASATIAVAFLLHLARPEGVATLGAVPIFGVPIVFGSAYGLLVGIPITVLSLAVTYLGVPLLVHLRSDGLTVYELLLDEVVQSLWLPVALLATIAVAVSAVASSRNEWVGAYRDRFKAIARRRARYDAGVSPWRGPTRQIRALPRTSAELFLAGLSKYVAAVVGGEEAAAPFIPSQRQASDARPPFSIVQWVGENGLPYSPCLQPELPTPLEPGSPDLVLPVLSFGRVYAVIMVRHRRSNAHSGRERMRHEHASLLAELAAPALESALWYAHVREAARRGHRQGDDARATSGREILDAAAATAELCPAGHSHGLLLLEPVRRSSAAAPPDLRAWAAPYLPVRSLLVVLDSPPCTAVLIPHIGKTGCTILAMDLLAVPMEAGTEPALAYETWSSPEEFAGKVESALAKLGGHRKALWE